RLHGTAVTKAEQFARFWDRIAAARGERPAELCVVGDLFDLVRSPTWFDGRQRPYHGATTNGVVKQVEHIVDETLRREAGFIPASSRSTTSTTSARSTPCPHGSASRARSAPSCTGRSRRCGARSSTSSSRTTSSCAG